MYTSPKANGVAVAPKVSPKNNHSLEPGMRSLMPLRSAGVRTLRASRRFTCRVPRYAVDSTVISILSATALNNSSPIGPLKTFCWCCGSRTM